MTTASEEHSCKHFRFAYQEEFRIVAIPAHAEEQLPFCLNVGDISDIAELVSESLCDDTD